MEKVKDYFLKIVEFPVYLVYVVIACLLVSVCNLWDGVRIYFEE